MERRCLTLFATVCCALLAGCGAGASHPPYIAEGDAVCTAQLARLHGLTQPRSPEQAIAYLPQALSIMHGEAGQLAALDPPAPSGAHLDAALTETRELSSLLAGFLHELKTGVVELSTFAVVQSKANALRAQIDKHFRAAGLTACAH
jgi:hypothetical protein